MKILQTNENGTFFNPTLLEHIKRKNNKEISLILEEVDTCDMTDSDGNTLLHFAAEYGNSEFAQQLIDSGVHVNVQNHMRQTPLMFAIFANDETVRLLLKANADIYLLDVNGECALGKACNDICKASDTLVAILEQVTIESLTGSRCITDTVFHNDCPLYFFVRFEKVGITQILLDSGSPVDAQEPITKKTALFKAVELLDPENIKLLLKYNADVNAKDFTGKTPLAYISPRFYQNEALEVLKILLAAGAILIDYTSRITMVYELLVYGNKEIVRTLLQCDIDLMYEHAEGSTLLHYLALNKHTDIFHEVLHLDFDIKVRCRWRGRTVLHDAVSVGNPSSIKFLLDQGLDVNDKDFYRRTPLFVATHPTYFSGGPYSDSHLKDCVNSVEILLERGADPYILTEENRGWDLLPFHRHNITDGLITVITPLFAKLAILEAFDQPMGPFMRDQIYSYERLKLTFETCKYEVGEMKEIEIDDSMTLLDFFMLDKDEIPRFAHKKWLVSNLKNSLQGFSTKTYFGHKLHERFMKFRELVEWRKSTLFVLHESLIAYCNLSLYNIVEKIVDHLLDEQWKEIM